MPKTPLTTRKPLPIRWFNRLYALVYLIAISALVYRHFRSLIISSPSFITISLLIADLVLAFMWTTWQAFFMNPVHHHIFPHNLPRVVKETDYPGLDVFVCTADAFKEPPIGVVNTVLSALAYEYPREKLSVYVSDDGGSQLSLFALMEGAKFARHWLPYCRKYKIMDRSPEVYFANHPSFFQETSDIQSMYNDMKTTIQCVMDQGRIDAEKLRDVRTIKSFGKWTADFTRQQHRTVIEVLLKSDQDKDVAGEYMPNLFYVAREKNKAIPHQFKAGAINALIRVSSVLTNAPIFLIMDCDTYSNDPNTPLHALCHFLDPNVDPKLGFVQFSPRFHNLNENDIYASEHVLESRVCTLGMDGLGGTIFMGSGGFLRRQALLEYPREPNRIWNEIAEDDDVMALAHRVASCGYEDNTKWGLEIGFRYGTLVEDVYTSFGLHCLGWKSVICNPIRAAFLGMMPVVLNEILSQRKRWYMGLLQLGFSKFSPMTYGMRFLNPLHAMCYAHFNLTAIYSIPIIIYAFLPQLALINSLSIFPKVSDPWFSLYAFLFLGTHAKDFIDHKLGGSEFRKWWNARRMWLIYGCSSYAFSIFDWFMTSIGMSTAEFNVTSKVSENDVIERHEKGVFEFGVESPLLFMVNIAAIVNLFAFLIGIKKVLIDNGRFEELFGQLFIAGFAMVNSMPLYEGMLLRSDTGKMPIKTTLKSVGVALVICLVFS